MYGFEAKEPMVENRYNIRQKMFAQLDLILGTNDHLPRLLKELFEGETYSVMDLLLRKGSNPSKLSASVARRQTKQSYQPCSRMRTTTRCSGTSITQPSLNRLRDVLLSTNGTQLEIEDGFRPIREMIFEYG